jgi:hypothetical protein
MNSKPFSSRSRQKRALRPEEDSLKGWPRPVSLSDMRSTLFTEIAMWWSRPDVVIVMVIVIVAGTLEGEERGRQKIAIGECYTAAQLHSLLY